MKFNFGKVDAAGMMCVAGLAAAAWFVVFQPSVNARAIQSSLRSEINTKNGELARLEGSIRAGRKELETLSAEYADHKLLLEPPTAVNTRQTRIGQAAETAGLKVGSLRNGEPAGKQKYPRVPIAMTGSGRAPAILDFLATMHREFRDTSIIGFEIESQPFVPDDQPRFTASINWFVDPGAVAPAAGEKDSSGRTAAAQGPGE